MPPDDRPIPRFIAETPQEALPYGRWAEALADRFLDACRRLDDEGEDLGEPGDVLWFPDRTYAGRTYVPATSPTSTGFEYFGYVSFTREHEGAEATDFLAVADFTDETADANPDWRLDLSDQDIATWRRPAGRRTRGEGARDRRGGRGRKRPRLRGRIGRQPVPDPRGARVRPPEGLCTQQRRRDETARSCARARHDRCAGRGVQGLRTGDLP